MSTIQKKVCLEWEHSLQQDNLADDNGMETPLLSSTGNILTLTLTDREFIEMLSALEQGAEIIYPDRVQEMTDKFLQGLLIRRFG